MPIRFGEAVTRAAITNADDITEFKVYAEMNLVPDNATDGSNLQWVSLFDGGEKVYRDNNNDGVTDTTGDFTYNNTRYWVNDRTFNFFAVHPYETEVVVSNNGDASENEANSRMISGIITGGSFLAGDNFVSPAKNSEKAFARYNKLLGNERLIEVLKLGKPFEAKLSPNCEYAAEIFTLEDDGKTYIAVLNFSILPKVVNIELPYKNSSVENLLTGKTQTKTRGKMTVTLEGRDSVIFEVTKK